MSTVLAPSTQFNLPPDDEELWSYARGRGRLFLQFSAISRLFLGTALVYLSFRGQWLLLLLPFAVMLVVGALISLVWSTQVPEFDGAAHRQRLRTGGKPGTSVDIFITTCGEDPVVVEHTLWRAASLQHDGPVRVHVLDDKGSAEVEQHAATWGATYLHRPNRGWMKKAGNLHHAYNRSDADFIVVLDADFAVRSDFLRHTLPYFDDETVGIVQTPQFFRVSNDNWVERGSAAQQEQFYRIGLRARDRRGGAICVGTNAVYRREALEARGGMALLEHSEDLFTGMKVLDAGYRVTYLPMVLAAGSAPSTTKALASQQYRWARGNFALAGTPLFKRLRLSPMQRLSIWDGWIFYVTSALSPVVAVVVPLLTLAEAPEAISLAPTLMLVPALITEFVLQPRWLFLSDGQASRRVGLISQIAHLEALRDHLSDREQEWVPTGDVHAGGKRQATDGIPELIAAVGLWGFLATVAMLGLRVAEGYSMLDMAPVAILAVVALATALTVTRPAERMTGSRRRRDRRTRWRSRQLPRHRPCDVDHPRSLLAHTGLLVDLVDLRSDASGLLRVGRCLCEEPRQAHAVAGGPLPAGTPAAAVRHVPRCVADCRGHRRTIDVPRTPAGRGELDHPVPQPGAAAVGGRLAVDAAVVPPCAAGRAAARPHRHAHLTPRPLAGMGHRLGGGAHRLRCARQQADDRDGNRGVARPRRPRLLRRVLRTRHRLAPSACADEPSRLRPAARCHRGRHGRGHMGLAAGADGGQQLEHVDGARRHVLAAGGAAVRARDPPHRVHPRRATCAVVGHRAVDDCLPVAHARHLRHLLPRRCTDRAR